VYTTIRMFGVSKIVFESSLECLSRLQLFDHKYGKNIDNVKYYSITIYGNTLLKGVCIDWNDTFIIICYKYDICYKYEWRFMHVCDNCH